VILLIIERCQHSLMVHGKIEAYRFSVDRASFGHLALEFMSARGYPLDDCFAGGGDRNCLVGSTHTFRD